MSTTLNLDIISKIINSPTGQLVTLKPGSYLRAPSEISGQPVGPFVDVPKETSALLLDFQGSHTKSLWHALVDGDVLLVGDDSYFEGPKRRAGAIE